MFKLQNNKITGLLSNITTVQTLKVENQTFIGSTGINLRFTTWIFLLERQTT